MLARVLAQLFLVACFAAGMVAACMVFIAYGPVPVRRKVTLVPRLAPRDVFADVPAAHTISLPSPIIAAQESVSFKPNPGVAFALPVPAVEPPAPAPKPEALVTPLVLRRPRGGSPPPLPRSRSARGTERRERPSELDLHENTAQTSRFLVEDDTFLEDGR